MLITYGSQYGSAKHYAEAFAALNNAHALSYTEIKTTEGYDCVIHFGALYAGGVLGLKHIASLIHENAKLVVVTVGLADVQDSENIQNIKRAISTQISEETLLRTVVFHLRGAIDYDKLNFKHRTMMALLHAKAIRLPEEKKNAETKAMIETYGKRVSFVDDAALRRLQCKIFSD